MPEMAVLVDALVHGPHVTQELLRKIEMAVPAEGDVISLSDAERGVLLGALLGADLAPESSPAVLRWLLLQRARPHAELHLGTEPGLGDS